MIIFLVIVSLSVLIFVHELGHFATAKFFKVKVEEFGFGFPPRIWGKKKGETIYSINLLPFGGFVRIFGEDAVESLGLRSFNGQTFWKRSAIVLAGVFMNIVLGWLVLSIVFMFGSPQHLMLSDVQADSPAAKAEMKGGDIVLEAGYLGQVLKDPIESQAFVDLSKSAEGQPIALKVQRGGDIKDIGVTGRVNPPAGQGSLGIGLVEVGFPAESFFSALATGFTVTISTIGMIAFSFFNFFSKLFVTPQILDTVSGPVGIFVIANQAGSLGIIYLLQLMAIISLNLAVLNLIPFPALDGGRFLFFLIEKLKGSPVSLKFQRVVNTAGFAFLIIIMVLVTIQDVGKIVN
jgi:regulator of sigma E protease